MSCLSYNHFFETIANKTRLNILQILIEGDLSVSEICIKLNEEQSKVSHNLKILLDCNFISVRQEGKKRIYSVNKETILPLMDLVKKHISSYCKICKKRQVIGN